MRWACELEIWIEKSKEANCQSSCCLLVWSIYNLWIRWISEDRSSKVIKVQGTRRTLDRIYTTAAHTHKLCVFRSRAHQQGTRRCDDLHHAVMENKLPVGGGDEEIDRCSSRLSSRMRQTTLQNDRKACRRGSNPKSPENPGVLSNTTRSL
jgi:hypothetical protein